MYTRIGLPETLALDEIRIRQISQLFRMDVVSISIMVEVSRMLVLKRVSPHLVKQTLDNVWGVLGDNPPRDESMEDTISMVVADMMQFFPAESSDVLEGAIKVRPLRTKLNSNGHG